MTSRLQQGSIGCDYSTIVRPYQKT